MSLRPRQLKFLWATQPTESNLNLLLPKDSRCQELLARLLRDVVHAELQERNVGHERKDSINPS